MGSRGGQEIIERGSLLLKFDPLVGTVVPTNTFTQSRPIKEEDESIDNEKEAEFEELQSDTEQPTIATIEPKENGKKTPEKEICDEKMSLVITNAMKDITIEDKLNAENNIMSVPDNESKMSELEKKAKNEV